MRDDTTFCVLKQIVTPEEAETLRKIRNECKDFMTRDTTEITYEQQQKWFASLPDSFKIYLLYDIQLGVIGVPIGYGLIREENDCYLISGGLTETSRGKGVGNILFEYLIGNVGRDKPLRLEVLKNNNRAFNVYNNLGFRVYSDDGKIIKMEYYYDSSI